MNKATLKLLKMLTSQTARCGRFRQGFSRNCSQIKSARFAKIIVAPANGQHRKNGNTIMVPQVAKKGA
ncbi:hypothetical protein OH492_15040 [Vibrio chagasii]|nr:hypothetical protein [Vibrio chagasii]